MIIRGLIYDIPINEINKDLLSITNIPQKKPPKNSNMIKNDNNMHLPNKINNVVS